MVSADPTASIGADMRSIVTGLQFPEQARARAEHGLRQAEAARDALRELGI